MTTILYNIKTNTIYINEIHTPVLYSEAPKIKKSGAETREELLNSLLLKSDISAPIESGSLPLTSVC